MKTTRILPLITIALGVAAGTALAAPAADNWDNHCASCHGADGKGQTKIGKKFKLRDYTDPAVQAELKDADMIKATTEGVVVDGKTKMKGFQDTLTADEIKDLVAQIRKFKA
jgi:mono/diheme cytochrome c family protein